MVALEERGGYVMRCDISSEYEKLRTVMVHEPGNEIGRLAPSNKDQLLFDDIPYLEEMRREHKDFVELLKQNGVESLEVRNLLIEILKDEEITKRLFDECMELERCRGLKNGEFLNGREPKEVAEILFSGLTYNEFEGKLVEEMTKKGEEFLIPPIPNFYFTRDPSAVIKDGVVSCKMFYPARAREALIMKYIFKFHPTFRGNSPFWYGIKEEEDRPYTIEGGDIILLNSDVIAIGNSERTRSHSIERLAQNLFDHDVVDVVYEVKIPHERTYMHLDTVFSVISEDIVVFYPEALKETIEMIAYRPYRMYGRLIARGEKEKFGLIDRLPELLGADVVALQTGGGDIRYSEKEQFADGTNTLAVAPKKVVTYRRNEKTNEVLEELGVKVLRIDGYELVRGRGGPRCMTMPLVRG